MSSELVKFQAEESTFTEHRSEDFNTQNFPSSSWAISFQKEKQNKTQVYEHMEIRITPKPVNSCWQGTATASMFHFQGTLGAFGWLQCETDSMARWVFDLILHHHHHRAIYVHGTFQRK